MCSELVLYIRSYHHGHADGAIILVDLEFCSNTHVHSHKANASKLFALECMWPPLHWPRTVALSRRWSAAPLMSCFSMRAAISI